MTGEVNREPGTEEEFLGQIRVGRSLGSLGDLMAISAAVLIGLLFVVLQGPAIRLEPSTLLAAGALLLILGLSTLEILELLGGSADGSGSYALVHETLAGVGSFLTGWSVLAANAIAAGAVSKLAAEIIVAELEAAEALLVPAAAGLVVLVCLFQLFGWRGWRSPARPLLLVAVGGLVVLILSIALAGKLPLPAAAEGSSPAPLAQAAQFAILYLGLETLLLSRRSIRTPRKDLPWALGLTHLLVLLLIGLPVLALGGLPIRPGQGIWDLLRSASPLPFYLTDLVALTALGLTLSFLVMNCVRVVNSMTLRGALPALLRTPTRGLPIPPGLFAATVAAIWAGLAVGTVAQTVAAASWFVVAVLIFVNLTGITSRRTEPDRRRWIQLPLFPIVPALSVAGLIALLVQLPRQAHAVGLIWGMAGLVLYTLYARAHQVEAQAGIVTFGMDDVTEKAEGDYRILVPLGEQKARRFALDLSVALAHQFRGDVIPLQVITIPDPMAVEEGRRVARERNTLFQWSLRRGSEAGVAVIPVTRLARSVQDGIVDTAIEEDCDLILLPWAVDEEEVNRSMGSIVDAVAVRAPCDLAIVAYRPSELDMDDSSAPPEERTRRLINTILVPTSGGPHAPLALGMALELAEEFDAHVRSVYVGEQGLSEADRRAGEARILTTLEAMRTAAAEVLNRDPAEFGITADQVERQVVEAEDVVEGIVRACADADLTLIGSSEESFIDQVLFGSIPRQVAARAMTPVIMVRRHRGLPRFWLRRLWEWLAGSLPTLEAADQIEVYKRVRRGARPDVDFFVMIGLSALLATFGLLLNSGAVIIGAMLVAPLFTPVLAFSMAIASGDVRVLRLGFEATLKGAFLAIGLALMVAILVPPAAVSLQDPEIASRVRPNLLDLGVALASGAAGAYAIARKDVAAALPGVAIAAALVPPLGVVGIALAAGSPNAALGAALLVVTNLIAISLSGALILLMLGFRPGQRGERRARLRTGLVASLILLVVVSVPLGIVLFDTVQLSQVEQTAHRTLQLELDATGSGIEVAETELREEGRTLIITASLHLTAGLAEPNVEQLRSALAEATGRPVVLRLLMLPVLESGPPPGS